MSLVEQSLQFVELLHREVGPRPPGLVPAASAPLRLFPLPGRGGTRAATRAATREVGIVISEVTCAGEEVLNEIDESFRKILVNFLISLICFRPAARLLFKRN